MNNIQNTINLVLKAVAVGMAVGVIVLGFIPEAVDLETRIGLLALGLFAVAVTSLQKASS